MRELRYPKTWLILGWSGIGLLVNTLGVSLGGITALTPLRDRLLWLERKLFV